MSNKADAKLCRFCRYYDAKYKSCFVGGKACLFTDSKIPSGGKGCDRWVYDTDRFCDVINAHLEKAIRKHRRFCRSPSPMTTTPPDYLATAGEYKILAAKDPCLLYVLMSEVYEFMEEAERGNYIRAEQEAADIVAVLIRVLARHMKE